MKRKLAEGGPSGGPGNPAGKSRTTPTGIKTVKEPKPTHTPKAKGESHLNRSVPVTNTLEISRRQPFTDYVMGAQLLIMWKGLQIDRYDGTIDPNEHMDVIHLGQRSAVLSVPHLAERKSLELVYEASSKLHQLL